MSAKKSIGIVLAACLITGGCRSRYRFKGGKPEGATDVSPGGDPSGAPKEGAPTVGIVATQKNIVVSEITASSQVTFRPSPETKGPAASECEFPDILDAVWTVAGAEVSHLTRKDLSDCADLSYKTTITNADSVIVQLVGKTSGGVSSTAVSTYKVISGDGSSSTDTNGGGDGTGSGGDGSGNGGGSGSGGSNGGSGGSTGTKDDPGQTPAQLPKK